MKHNVGQTTHLKKTTSFMLLLICYHKNAMNCYEYAKILILEKCPDRTYTYFPDIGYCIKSYTDSVSWDVAHKLCRAEGADLIEPTTTTKMTILQWLMRNKADGMVAIKFS